ncbi:MAG: hypothetical protein KGL74_03525 [Elusimicrobia bacterium]|nr:hypothetical protein [Elusimicrobiota bacterium]
MAESRAEPVVPLLAACALLIAGVCAAREAPSRKDECLAEAEAAALYQSGVQEYARGRLPEALRHFEAASRLNPNDRAARSAVLRLRAESPRVVELPGHYDARRASPPRDGGVFAWLEALAHFESTVGDARSGLGSLRARQGRIAQLLIERRVCRERRRAFAKNGELHALSRRLSSGLS